MRTRGLLRTDPAVEGGQPEHVGKIVIAKEWMKAEASPSSTCDDPNRISNPHNGHCYQKITTPMTWHAAKDYCESLGGYLATVTSQEERDFVYRHFKDAKHFLWIGGTDEADCFILKSGVVTKRRLS
ncbi:hypothetical protein U27_05319 [Candidatus Vecturithrix granuli]|uniref:C-type lectin domain-containing protein n=1 Tax=Vecturithrix granuli TaxID=1499967 RepID=A0A081C190_VECG1|nr:hypothetical protein U27_05319 [Candidatus Vecturithrix granuli]